MKFITETGSMYEVNHTTKQIRRLTGNNDPTSRQGHDGEWKSFYHVDVKVHKPAIIFWNSDTPLLQSNTANTLAVPATMTSLVIQIIEE